MNFGNFGMGELFTLFLISLIAIWPAWRICAKTGNSGALAIGLVVPLVNILIWLYLAFSEWPIEQELQHLRGSRSLN